MQHDVESNSKKQKRVDQPSPENVWMFVTVDTSDDCTRFHMIEINKETHKEIYKDLRRFEREDVEIRIDYTHDISPFIKLKSGNYATMENYQKSEEWKRWYEFYETIKYKEGIECSCKNLKEISRARFWVAIQGV
jgi:cAMP phosphodiesterase